MKTKSNIAKLLEHGYHYETVSQLNDKQVGFLIERIKKEESKEEVKQTVTNVTYDPANAGDQKILAQKGIHVDPTTKKISMTLGSAGEVKEDETADVTSSNALGKDALQDYTGQEAPHMANNMAPDGMDDDSDTDRSNMGMAESTINEKFKSKAQQGLFWARCNKCSSKNCKWCKMAKEFSDSTSKKQYKEMPKKLHPKKKVSKKTNESYELEMEKELLRILENHINPSMTKTEFVNTLMEKKESMMLKSPIKNNLFSKDSGIEMKKPIGNLYGIGKEMGENTKEKERTKKPGTKPKTRPNDNPFDDPNPDVKEKPKAHTKEKERTKKPGTKPKTRPNDNPFDDPNPDVKEKPKASDKKTKNEFLSLINKALNM